MDDRFMKQAWAFANQFVGKTIRAENDFDGRKFAAEARGKAYSHDWLYHCTSTDGLLGILKSREFWLKNLKNVNDDEEADRIDAPNYEKSFYICCFSYDYDVPMEHWVEYGAVDDGVVIGVKRNWFSREPVFMTSSFQKCEEENMKIIGSYHEALNRKIQCQMEEGKVIDPYHIFDFDFYQIVYDDMLKKTILGNCEIDFEGVAIPGRSITPSVAGIIKSREGMCRRPGREAYHKKWYTEKEVRLKAGIHRLSKSMQIANQKTIDEPYFKQLAVPLLDGSFDTIRIAFSPNYVDRNMLLDEIQSIYPDSVVEVLN